jgi:hypothetical protein
MREYILLKVKSLKVKVINDGLTILQRTSVLLME